MRKQLSILIYILTIKAAIIAAFVIFGNIDLAPDEAQYWTWSQNLDWGYYSKPLGIAYQIWFGTKLFGNTVFGIRFFSIVMGFLLPIAVYFLAKKSGLSEKACFWAGTIFALSPLGFLLSLVATTDVGYILFWTLTAAEIAFALNKKTAPSYFRLGIFIMVGALFKWPIYLMWLFVLCFAFFYKNLRSKKIIFGILISLIALIPAVIWNMGHEWATFKHVFFTLSSASKNNIARNPFGGNFQDFLGAQIALFSPIYFLLLLPTLHNIGKKKAEVSPAIIFCAVVSLIILLNYTVLSISNKMQGNWAIHAYPTAAIIIAWYANKKERLLKLGAAVALAIVLIVFSIPYIQSSSLFPQKQIPYKINPLRQFLGWSNLKEELKKTGYDPQKNFLFSNKYQEASELSFYGPKQKRAYFLNIEGIRRNQFSFWPSMKDEQVSKNGFFVAVLKPYDNEQESLDFYKKELTKYFETIEEINSINLFNSYGKPVKRAFIFKCISFNGKIPEENNLY